MGINFLFSIFMVFMVKNSSFVFKLKKNTILKAQDKPRNLQIVIFNKFQVITKVSYFVNNPVYLPRNIWEHTSHGVIFLYVYSLT